MTTLSPDEIARRLGGMDGWSLAGSEIRKTFELPTFPSAIAFVGRIADLAEEADHHPDMDIRYTKLEVRLSTHDAGGLTEKDFALAEAIEAALGEHLAS